MLARQASRWENVTGNSTRAYRRGAVQPSKDDLVSDVEGAARVDVELSSPHPGLN